MGMIQPSTRSLAHDPATDTEPIGSVFAAAGGRPDFVELLTY